MSKKNASSSKKTKTQLKNQQTMTAILIELIEALTQILIG